MVRYRFQDLILLWLSVCLAAFVVMTMRWPMISDASLMHYVVFLIHHGMAPYRDIVDVNMPGTYLLQDAVAHVFKGALGWRIFDLSLMAVSLASMVVLARPYGLLPGCIAGVLFALMHGGDGVDQMGQRDLVIAVFLLAGYASLFVSLRRSNWPWSGVFGLCCGSATTIKPQVVLLAAALLLLTAYALKRRGRIAGPYLAAALAGFLIPVGVAAAFLARERAIGAFLATLRGLILLHAGLARHTTGFLLSHTVPTVVLPLLIIAAWLAVRTRYWRHWEGCALLLGIGFGIFSFYLQGKAYPYHRYPLMAFLLVFLSIQLVDALRRNGWPRCIAIAGLLYCGVWVAPASIAKALRYNWRDQTALVQLQADLDRLGGSALSGQVQCMDTTAGCITVLDRMKLIQSTGFLYDCYFFTPGDSIVKSQLRSKFWDDISARQPDIFIVTNEWCLNLPAGYQKLDQWPQFKDFLLNNYSLSVQREWAVDRRRHLAATPFGYRIYVKK